MPYLVRKRDNQFCVYKEGADGQATGDSLGCHATEAAARDQVKALYANVKEFRGMFSDVLVVTELRGSYPNVPISSDVDYDGLIAEDTRAGTQPVFLTVPIGKVGVTSGNRRHYDEAFVTELERQTLANKPVGLMGHLSETERATAFPAEAVHWVGAIRDGDTLWGKAYVVPGAVRDRIQRYKAQGKAIATSIDAFAEGIYDETLKAMRMVAKTLRLNQIDIAPADRAGIPDLAAVPFLTTEMDAASETEKQQESKKMPDKLEIIQELKREDARLLPDEVRAAILESVQTPPEVATVQEIRAALGVDDKADLTQVIREMRQKEAEQAKAAVTNRITELVTEGVKVESVRGLVTELVNARNPQTADEAATAYQQVIEMQSVKDTLAATVQRTMGPRQTTPVAPQTGKAKYFQIPQEA
jgi:hypothetical protein